MDNIPDQKTIELPPLTIIGSKDTVVMPFSAFGLDSNYTKATIQTPERNNLVIDNESSLENINLLSSNYGSAPLIRSSSVFENSTAAATTIDSTIIKKDETKKSYTKVIIFGVALLVVIGLFILLEKFKGQEEE